MVPTIGIDLGTSKCCVAIHGSRGVELLPTAPGAQAMPSVVAYDDRGQVVVGNPALERGGQPGWQAVPHVKRLLGRKYHSPAVSWLRELWPCELLTGGNGDAWVRAGGAAHSPQEVTAVLLGALRRAAEAALGASVERAVIAVPVFFDAAQRRALMEAVQIAGLETRLVSDTTAAALAYALEAGAHGRLAVLDLGAGHLGVAVVEGDQAGLKVAAAAGDTLLGTEDLDRRLVARMVREVHQRERIDLRGDFAALWRLHSAAQRVRHELSKAPRSEEVSLRWAAADGASRVLHLSGMDREQLAASTSQELAALGDPCAWVLEDLELGTDDVDELLLIGGGMRMPVVRGRIEELFRRRAAAPRAPGELVVRGAACAGAILDGTLDVDLTEISTHSVGVKVRGGRFSPIIERGRPTPCREQKVFAPARAGQAQVALEVYQGEGEQVRDNTYLGRFVVEDLEPNKPVVVEFSLDANGQLEVLNVDATSGAADAVSLQHAGGLSATAVERLSRRQRALLAAAFDRGSVAAAPQPLTRAAAAAIAAPVESRAPTVATPPGRPSVRPGLPARGKSMPSAGPITVADDALVGTTLGDRYEILAIVADGGMGRVYRARHKLLSRIFAIKVLHSELAGQESLADRFVLEAQAAANIHSEHVVDISDFGRLPDGAGYFVMEYLEGQTLAELIAERGALPAALICDIGNQVAMGLAAAHQVGVVHRDLKPSNITLVERGTRPYFCKIVDFGIAKSSTSDTRNKLTHVGMLLGTPHYMAPEQIDGEAEPRSDIYALGAVMYEMATGQPPFDADSVVGLLVKHKCEEAVPVRQHEVAVRCPAALEAIIMRCLAKRPEQRFESAKALAVALGSL